MIILRRLLAHLSVPPRGVREDHIAADDRLLSILGSREATAVVAASDPLVRLLLAWRADVDGPVVPGRCVMADDFRKDYGPEYGDPRLPERFWSKVHPEPNTGCWLWAAQINEAGYGTFRWVRPGRSYTARAHRTAYEALVRPIPDDLVCDHLCRTRACVNPAHLDIVTHKVNILRGEGPSAANAKVEQCRHGHDFTPENTFMKRRGSRVRRECRQCNRDRAARLWRAGQATKQKRARGDAVTPRNRRAS